MTQAQDPAASRLEDERLRALATTTLAIVWLTAADGSIVAQNDSWAAFTGQTRDAYAGRGWLDAVHPDDRDRVASTWQAALEARSRIAIEYRLRRADGRWREVAAEGAPVLREGTLCEWVGYCIDMTEGRRTEAASRESEAQLRLLDRLGQATRAINDATELMAVSARLLGEHLGATRTAYADVEADNDCFHIRADWSLPGVPSSAGTYSLALFGPLAVANLHRGITLVVRDVDRELGGEGGARMFNAIGIKAIVCAGLVKEGKLVAMMAVHQATPRDWREGEIATVGEVVERCWAHIERVRDTAKLREQDRRKDEFLALLGHELRNPLAPLRHAAAVLRLAAPGGAEARAAGAMIERQVGHMARLIDDLLDLSRINRGLIQLKRETVALSGLLQQSVETARPQLEKARHRLEVQLPEEELAIVADPARIVQAVGNLLNNAAKYTPDGGHIRLAARRASDRVAIEVADTGIGIPPDQQGRLFQMFTQLEHSAARAQGGLGIGLALVKTLAQLHGGDVRARSAGLDEGSTFTIELPLAPAALRSDARKAPQPPARKDSPMRVLVVEDNPDGLESLLTLLGLMGFEVEGAADGPSGLAAASRFKPRVVLLDLGLPGMSGIEVGRTLRAAPEHAGLAIVALTGWGADADRERTAKAGFDCHLTKPVDPHLLRDTLRRLASEPA